MRHPLLPPLATLTVIGALLSPAAQTQARAAEPTEGRPLVALVSIDHGEEVDPRLSMQIEMELRGVALEEDVAIKMVSLAQRGVGDCDAGCLAGIADPIGAQFVLSGVVMRRAEGLELHLELRDAGVPEAFDGATITAPDSDQLLDRAAEEGRRLLARTSEGVPPEAEEPTPPRRSVIARPRMRPYAARPYLSPVPTKSVALALVLELVLPGVGLIYADAPGEAALEWGAMLVGGIMIISAVGDEYDGGDSGGRIALGLVLLAGGRIYGLIRAPTKAAAMNRRALDAWEWSQRERGAWAPPRPFELGQTILSPAPMTTFTLPTVSF